MQKIRIEYDVYSKLAYQLSESAML